MFGYAYGTLFFFSFCVLAGLYIFVQSVISKEGTVAARAMRAIAGLVFFVVAILGFMQVIPTEVIIVN